MITVVTCFYIIKSKHKLNHYNEWIHNFMNVNTKMNKYIFCDKVSYEYLYKKYKNNENIYYCIKEISDFHVCKLNYDWKKEETKDKRIHLLIGHNEQLYKIWNEKVFFIIEAINNNIYKSEIFIWLDIGCFRNEKHLQYFNNFPNINKMDVTKLTFLQLFEKNKYVVGAGCFGGPIDLFVKFALLYEQMLAKYTLNNKFKGVEQNLYKNIIDENPSIFNIIEAIEYNNYDKWFYMHYYWC